jgi:hypothetical protein
MQEQVASRLSWAVQQLRFDVDCLEGIVRTTLAVLSVFVLFVALVTTQAPEGLTLGGSLARTGVLSAGDLEGLAPARRLVKIADAAGAYRTTLEVEGFTLKDVLDRFDVKKAVDDGYNRPLDTYIDIRGRKGDRAIVSYSEAFLVGDGGPLLVSKARYVLPHKHETLDAADFDASLFMDIPKRRSVDVSMCSACHDGGTLVRIAPPQGWMLVVPQDGFGGRFVEDVERIDVQQVGITVKADKAAGEKGLVETPDIVGIDGARTPLAGSTVAAAAHDTWKDATYGMGMGFHGYREWEGITLASVLRPLVPAGTDLRRTWVLVTAIDGYRSLYSGSEVFVAPKGREVMLADKINGKAPGVGSGRYHIVPRADFYIDRDVRMVKEIRIGLAK